MNRPFVSAFGLKIAAIAGMTCNHVANVFAFALPGWATVALYMFGGLTFPIMAFLLCEGYRHTSNVRRYALRLAAFAAVSQIPYSLLWGATANVMVTLLVGLGLLWANDHLANRGLFALAVVGGIALTWFCDWGIIGPVMILLFHYLHDRPRGAALVMLVPVLAFGLPALQWAVQEVSFAEGGSAEGSAIEQLIGEAAGVSHVGELGVESPAAAAGTGSQAHTVEAAAPVAASLGTLGYYTVGFGLATLLMLAYNGKRGRPLKWFFYGYYPGHLAVLWALTFLWG